MPFGVTLPVAMVFADVQVVVREIVAHGTTAVRVDGPYGDPTELEPSSMIPILLVAGGVGVRPSLLRCMQG